MRVVLTGLALLLALAGCTGGKREAVRMDEASDIEHFDRLWNYGDPAGTEQKFRALLTDAEDRPELRAQLLTQIARCQGLQRDFDAAHATLDAVEAGLGAEPSVAALRLRLERGRTFNSSGFADRAVPLFESALRMAENLGEEFHAIDAAHMLGIAETGEAGLEWNLRAIAMAEAAADPRARGWLGSLLNNTGWTYHDRGEFETALDHFERALAFRREQGREPGIRIARWCVARCLRSLERYDEALATQRALAAELAAAGESDGYVDEELGELLLVTGRAEAATPHFARAYELLSQDAWLVAQEPERLGRLRELGGLPD